MTKTLSEEDGDTIWNDPVDELEKPGSKGAIEAGCSCPVIDNYHGKGVPNGDGEPLFWYSGNCEYHKEGDDG